MNINDRLNLLKVDFREINPSLAYDFHKTFHYIHAPRVKRSFGMFLEGCNIPFTVVGIDSVDRDYKKEGLMAMGYDPDLCLDFTRLYSWPGVPKNSSSVIFSLVKSRILEEHPNLQAAISTFMPTYANGSSMLAGGFEKSFLIKRNTHRFGITEYMGKTGLEHLTNRRAENLDNIIISKQILLPVVELYAEFKKPRWTPLIKNGREMFVKEF